jgi:predicted  nucleic acid-binding Zn-ribbon protein
MRVRMGLVLCCLVAFSCLVFAGCKKAEEGAPPAPTSAGAGTVKVDTEKPVAEVQTEAQKMSVENLKAVALQYKQAITAKQAELEKLIAKIKEIPLTEALGQEAQALKTDVKSLETSLSALKERFQVYYNTLKEKGGSLTGLEI